MDEEPKPAHFWDHRSGVAHYMHRLPADPAAVAVNMKALFEEFCAVSDRALAAIGPQAYKMTIEEIREVLYQRWQGMSYFSVNRDLALTAPQWCESCRSHHAPPMHT